MLELFISNQTQTFFADHWLFLTHEGSRSLTPQQQKVAAVALVVLSSLLGTYYLIRRSFRKGNDQVSSSYHSFNARGTPASSYAITPNLAHSPLSVRSPHSLPSSSEQKSPALTTSQQGIEDGEERGEAMSACKTPNPVKRLVFDTPQQPE